MQDRRWPCRALPAALALTLLPVPPARAQVSVVELADAVPGVGQVLEIEDLAIPGPSESLIAVLQIDGIGKVISRSAAVHKGMTVAGTTVTEIKSLDLDWDLNASASLLFAGRLSAPVGKQEAVILDDTILGQPGTPSPVAGRDWNSLSSAVSLNDVGGTALPGSLAGDSASRFLIVRDGAEFVQQGDPLPLDDELSDGGFGVGSLCLGNDGSLQPGSSGSITLTDVKPLCAASLDVGPAAIDAPFKGGTMVPYPLLLLPLATNALGALQLAWANWPAGLPGGTPLLMQCCIADSGGPVGLSASNGLRGRDAGGLSRSPTGRG